jgi:hypothetical protein
MMKVTRAVGYAIALLVLSGAPLWADPSDCAEWGQGGQTGQSYHLESQSLATETTSGSLSVGGPACGVGGSAGGTFAEQYHIGYYRNLSTQAIARVDCRTGRILGWV